MKLLNNQNFYKILIVDDLESNRDLVAAYLKQSVNNYHCYFAVNGNDCILKATEIKPDLILLDWEMPLLDGLEALKIIRSTSDIADIPIIMLTALTSEKHLAEAFIFGANDFIRKPLNRLELLARITSTLSLSISYTEIKNQKNNIQETNTQLQESIKYAGYIQRAMLYPSEDLMQKFKNSFIIYKPKTYLSGDFYWYSKLTEANNNIDIFAVVDCTGHGIPASFLSIIGSVYLDQIILQKNIHSPQLILKYLNKYVRKTLRQNTNSNVDGMEISICSVNASTKTVLFASSVHVLIYFADGIMHQIEGDFMEIGGVLSDDDYNFTLHTINVSENLITDFYLFTDGFIDQFGGAYDRKFLPKRFKEIITKTGNNQMETQKSELLANLENWMDKSEQIDDILVIGFSFDIDQF